MSVEVVTSTPIDDYGMHSMRDVAAFIAAFDATNQGPGSNKYFMRGITDGAFTRQQAIRHRHLCR